MRDSTEEEEEEEEEEEGMPSFTVSELVAEVSIT